MRWLVVGALLVLAAAADAADWRRILAPAPVAAAHAAIDADCEACHVELAGTPDAKCLDCHEAIVDGRARGDGFHAGVADQNCHSCHTDHVGADGSMTRPEALAAFDHADTRFPLASGHAAVACKDCHRGSLETLATDCGSCHADAHDGDLGSECAACHTATTWEQMRKSTSDHTLPLTGAHAPLVCVDCHRDGTRFTPSNDCGDCHTAKHPRVEAACTTCHTVASWQPATFTHADGALPAGHETLACDGCHVKWQFTNAVRNCSACHESDRPHAPMGECDSCHVPTTWTKLDGFDHNADTDFALTGRHLAVNCDGCHRDERQPGAAPTACSDCHADAGRAAHGEVGDCAGCHGTNGFDQSSFDHASTDFPLRGKHAAVRCVDCHAQEQAAPVSAPPVAAAPKAHSSTTAPDVRGCADCHDDPHAGSTTATCDSCHTESAFVPSTFDAARHARTALPLTGVHAITACGDCHVDQRLAGTPTTCGDCHKDPHAGTLGAACADCHGTDAFVPVADFDHARTGFELGPVHAELTCDSCHQGANGDSLRAVRDSGNAATCAACHRPQHSTDLGTDCARCHAPLATSFADARGIDFDHAVTGFPLERRHQGLACGDCHMTDQPRPEGVCGSCHLDPHAGGMSPECEACHRPDRWRLARFDHDFGGWPLRGRHFSTPCASCHVNQRWVGIPTDCFDCHALDAARANDLRRDHPVALFDCLECHTSQSSWKFVRGRAGER